MHRWHRQLNLLFDALSVAEVDKQKAPLRGLQCNEGLFNHKYVALQSFPSHCRTKGTSHQIRVIRGFDSVNQLTEQNHLCHQNTELTGFSEHQVTSDRKDEE